MAVKNIKKIGQSFSQDEPKHVSGKATQVQFSSLSNLAANDDKVATAKVTESSGQTPKAVALKITNFGFNINNPNATIKGIEAQWEDFVRNNSDGTTLVPNIPSTTLKLLNITGGKSITDSGISPTIPSSGKIGDFTVAQGVITASTERTHYIGTPFPNVIINGVKQTLYNLWGASKITPAQVNSTTFGVTLDYAKNKGSYPGKINVDYIALNVYYEDPEYSLKIEQNSTSLINGTVTATITLKNINNAYNGVAIPVTLTLPNGLEYVSSDTSSGKYGSYDKFTNKWDAKLTGANGSAVLKLTLKATKLGSQQIKAVEYYTKKAATGTTNVITESYTIKSNYGSDISVIEGEDFTYTITVETNQDIIKNKTADIALNSGVILRKVSSQNGNYNIKTGKWNLTFSNRKATITFYLTAVAPGDYIQKVSLDTNLFSQNFIIIGQEVTHCSHSIIEPPESFFQFLEDGEIYTLSAYCIVNDTYLQSIYNGVKNNKIGVLIGENEVLGTRCLNVNTDIPERIYVEFTYNEDSPLKIIIYGQYLELDLTNSMTFGAWELKKGPYIDEDYQNPVILFPNLQSLIENIDYTSTTIPTRRSTAKYNFKNIDFAGLESDKYLIKRGIGICFDFEIENEIIVEAQIHSDKSSTRRSVILNPESNFVILGDLTEKWGLKSHEINLNNFSFDLKFINTSIVNQEIKIKNVNIILFYEKDTTGGSRYFLLDGEPSYEYGIFLLDAEDEGGANNKLEKLSLKGSDGELGTGSTIEAKTIPLKFNIGADTLEEAEILFQKAVQWLTKDRDKRLIPAKQELILSWAQNISYLVVAEGSFKKKYNVSTIESQVDFVVLDGIGYSRENKVTGPTGVNNGLTTVYPTLQVICLGGPISIFESVDQQEMILPSFENGRILTIDCDKRTIFDDLGNDHTNKVSLSWGWFGLLSDYDFSSSENCYVEKVMFKEGIG